MFRAVVTFVSIFKHLCSIFSKINCLMDPEQFITPDSVILPYCGIKRVPAALDHG